MSGNSCHLQSLRLPNFSECCSLAMGGNKGPYGRSVTPPTWGCGGEWKEKS